MNGNDNVRETEEIDPEQARPKIITRNTMCECTLRRPRLPTWHRFLADTQFKEATTECPRRGMVGTRASHLLASRVVSIPSMKLCWPKILCAKI